LLGSAATGVIVVLMLISASPAAAVQTHFFEAAVGVGELSFPGGLAVDNSTGDLYVADAGLGAVVRFDSTGAPDEFPATGTNTITGISWDFTANQIAVDQEGANAGDFYITNSFGGGIQAFTQEGAPANFSASAGYISGNTLSGTPASPFSEACGVAVDSSGAIYVGDYGGFVDVYAPSGEFLAQFETPAPCSVAVDSAGNVYVNEFAGAVRVYNPSSMPVSGSTTYGGPGAVTDEASFGIAVDDLNDQVYVNQGNQVEQFSSFSEGNHPIVTFGAEQLHEGSSGVAVDRSGGATDGDVYASKAGEVDRFGPLVTIPPALPVVLAESAGAGSTEADLKATIDPGNTETTYYFEYGPTGAYGNRTPDRTIPEGSHPVQVTAHLLGLARGTTYHFRIVVSNSVGEVAGEDRTFSTAPAPGPDTCDNAAIRARQGSSFLPDCRAYEMASPQNKNGIDVKDNDGVQAAADGGGAVFDSLGGFADAPSAPISNFYRTERDAEGWTTRAISPPVLPLGGGRFLNPQMLAISANLSTTLMRSHPAPPSVPGEQLVAEDFYRRELPDGAFENLTPEVPDPANFRGLFAGTDDALGTVGINSLQQLTSDSPPGENMKAYVWQGGELHYVGVLPGNTLANNSEVGGIPGLESHNAISDDGSRIIFTSRSGGASEVYVREDLTTTVEASASQRVPPEPVQEGESAEFQGASNSGDRVFFTSPQQLLNSDTNFNRDLYVFEPETKSLRLLSVDTEPADGEVGEGVVRVLGMGETGDASTSRRPAAS